MSHIKNNVNEKKTLKKNQIICSTCNTINNPDKKKKALDIILEWHDYSPLCSHCNSYEYNYILKATGNSLDTLKIKINLDRKSQRNVNIIHGYSEYNNNNRNNNYKLPLENNYQANNKKYVSNEEFKFIKTKIFDKNNLNTFIDFMRGLLSFCSIKKQIRENLINSESYTKIYEFINFIKMIQDGENFNNTMNNFNFM
jgi:hypothetical protein